MTSAAGRNLRPRGSNSAVAREMFILFILFTSFILFILPAAGEPCSAMNGEMRRQP
jgi:hypothetical protein